MVGDPGIYTHTCHCACHRTLGETPKQKRDKALHMIVKESVQEVVERALDVLKTMGKDMPPIQRKPFGAAYPSQKGVDRMGGKSN